MAIKSYVSHFKLDRELDLGFDGRPHTAESARRQLANVLASPDKFGCNFYEAFNFAGNAQHASAFLNINSGTGDLTATINGVANTVTWATSDANTASLLVTAINVTNIATSKGFVWASRRVATLTLASVVAGTELVVCGYRFTATATATGKPFEFSISGNDSADATALANAINASPGCGDIVRAQAASNVVYVGLSPAVSGAQNFSAVPGGGILEGVSTITTANGALADTGANIFLWCPVPGIIGNAVSLAVTGTGLTAIGSATAFGRGAGLDDDDLKNIIWTNRP